MKEPLIQLREVHALQSSDGNWNFNPYMHGMANGLELALAIFEGREPRYFEAPDVWLADKTINDVTPESAASSSCV